MVVFPTRTGAEPTAAGAPQVDTLPRAKAVAERSRRYPVLLGAALAVLAVAVCLVATRDGVGVSPDSAVYLGTAENLARGDGLTVPFRPYPLSPDAGPLATTERLDNFPPLYPAVVAGLSRATGLEARTVARALNAVLLGALVLFVFMTLVVAAAGRVAVPLVVAVLTLVSADVLITAAMAWTELLFTVLAVLGLVCVALQLETPRRRTLWAAAILIALACLTRLAGVALVITAAVSLLLLSRRPWRARLKETALVVAVGALPVLLWAGATAVGSDRLANRELALHPVGSGAIGRASETAVSWMLPGHRPAHDDDPVRAVIDVVAGVPVPVRGLLAVAIVAVLVVLGRRSRGPATTGSALALSYLPRVLIVFLGAYVGFLLFASSVLDASLARLDHRILMPAHVCVLVAAGLIVLRRIDLRRFWRPALAVTVPVLLLLIANATVSLMDDERFAGGFTAERWRESPIMAAIRRMPAERTIVTNEPSGVWAVTGRSTAPVPEQKSVVTLRANRALETELLALGRAMQRDDAVLVYIDGAGESPFPVSEAKLLDTLPLRLVQREPDGRVYEIGCPAANQPAAC